MYTIHSKIWLPARLLKGHHGVYSDERRHEMDNDGREGAK